MTQFTVRPRVLHQCIRPLVGALLRAIMDISARAISLGDRAFAAEAPKTVDVPRPKKIDEDWQGACGLVVSII